MTPDRERGSIAMALLLTLVGMMASALLVPLVLSQVQSTTVDTHRLRSLNAAQAGLDVAVAHIRAARDGSGNGMRASLPCGPLAGTVSGGGAGQYQVTIGYYSTDPQGQSASWLSANVLRCSNGYGAESVPGFALLTAKGTDATTGTVAAATGRTLSATYTFQTTNANIAGGLIHVYKTATSTDLCLDAGSGSPSAGTNVQMQPCNSGSVRQTFAYQSNLNLVLVNTKTTSSLGMCLDAGSLQLAGSVVTFQPCSSTTLARQQWSINDNANFEGTADGSTLDGLCFNVQNPNVAGSFVILGARAAGKCYGGYDNQQTFSPEAAVGAGAAGMYADATGAKQLVNFKQFGRCLDVTNQDVTYAYLIAWPCKQAPNFANVSWNQKWLLPTIPSGSSSGTGKITTTKSTTAYCLRSPLSTAAGQYVTVAACPGTIPDNMTWTVYTDTGTYATSYTILDKSGYCLQPTDPNATPPDLFSSGQQISKMTVATCNGSTLQKWNAPPRILPAPPLKNVGETG